MRQSLFTSLSSWNRVRLTILLIFFLQKGPRNGCRIELHSCWPSIELFWTICITGGGIFQVRKKIRIRIQTNVLNVLFQLFSVKRCYHLAFCNRLILNPLTQKTINQSVFIVLSYMPDCAFLLLFISVVVCSRCRMELINQEKSVGNWLFPFLWLGSVFTSACGKASNQLER